MKTPKLPSFRMRSAGALILFGAASLAHAGGSVSSGGGSFRDQHNPWFLRNVKQVAYCVARDEATFSASLETARDGIRKAISYWQQQFSGVQNLGAGSGAELATQTFVEVECAQPHDLQFVFGYGGLAPGQVDFFRDANDRDRDTTDYIGVTVRTDYDEITMRGRGYVYISSDKAAHVYKNDGNLITAAWSQPNLLLYALIHETGHVFGFPHTGSGIMSEVFLEQMLDQHLTHLFQNNAIQSFLIPGPVFDVCTFLTQGTAAWFGMPAGTDCLRMELGGNQIPVFAYKKGTTTTTPIGAFKGLNVSGLTDMRNKPGVLIHLTPKQTVFTPQETGFRGFLMGPSFVDFGAQANYLPIGGTAKSAYLRFTSTSFTVTAAQGPTNKLGVVFSYESPIDLLLVQQPAPATRLRLPDNR